MSVGAIGVHSVDGGDDAQDAEGKGMTVKEIRETLDEADLADGGRPAGGTDVGRDQMNWSYARLDYKHREHHVRYKRFVESRPPLSCQECRGAGGWTEPILDDGTGPFEECGWCEGTGLISPYKRGMWLKFRREERNYRRPAALAVVRGEQR